MLNFIYSYKNILRFCILFPVVSIPLIVTVKVGALSMDAITSSTNIERTKTGMAEYKTDERLISAATAKAKDMCTNNYWAHTAPDGTTGWYFVKQSGYNYKTAGENLAKGFISDQAIVDAWMASPKHRDNILHSKFKDIGIGSFPCGTDTIVVAMYGSEQSNKKSEPPAETEPVQTSDTPSVNAQKSVSKDSGKNIIIRMFDEVGRLINQNYVIKRMQDAKHHTLS